MGFDLLGRSDHCNQVFSFGKLFSEVSIRNAFVGKKMGLVK